MKTSDGCVLSHVWNPMMTSDGCVLSHVWDSTMTSDGCVLSHVWDPVMTSDGCVVAGGGVGALNLGHLEFEITSDDGFKCRSDTLDGLYHLLDTAL